MNVELTLFDLLQSEYEAKIIVNFNNVLFFQNSNVDNDKTIINFINGDKITVKESLEQIKNKISL